MNGYYIEKDDVVITEIDNETYSMILEQKEENKKDGVRTFVNVGDAVYCVVGVKTKRGNGFRGYIIVEDENKN